MISSPKTKILLTEIVCNRLFTREEVRRLEQLTLYDVIMAVTRMEIGDLQENPFLSPSEGKIPVRICTMKDRLSSKVL